MQFNWNGLKDKMEFGKLSLAAAIMSKYFALPWQAEYISANVPRFYKILVKCTYLLDFAF